MLSKIEEFGKNKGYFQYTKIGLRNKKRILGTKTDVIDFDKTKDILYKGDRYQPSSCDALKFICEQNRLDFLELKSVVKIIENAQRIPPTPIEESIQGIKTKIPKKIEDSKKIMKSIVSHEELSLSEKELSEYATCAKNFYLIVDRDIFLNGFSTFYFDMLFSSAFRQIESENPIIVKGLMEIDDEYQISDQ